LAGSIFGSSQQPSEPIFTFPGNSASFILLVSITVAVGKDCTKHLGGDLAGLGHVVVTPAESDNVFKLVASAGTNCPDVVRIKSGEGADPVYPRVIQSDHAGAVAF
jgi:hypothetical protein